MGADNQGDHYVQDSSELYFVKAQEQLTMKEYNLSDVVNSKKKKCYYIL